MSDFFRFGAEMEHARLKQVLMVIDAANFETSCRWNPATCYPVSLLFVSFR